MPTNREAPLLARRPLGGGFFLLTFRHAEVAHASRAGQFVMMKAGASPEPPLRRPYSILSVDPTEDAFTLFVKSVGAGSRALADMREGDLALCLGPLGRPFTPPEAGTEAVLVAGGYGIAPFHLFGDELRRAGRRSRVFYGGRTAADLPLRFLFEGRDAPLHAATDDGSFGFKGRVTEAVDEYVGAPHGPVHLYGCGPDAMLHALARLAASRDLPVQVSVDPWMGCGIGTCLGCVVRIQRAHEDRPHRRCACTEGPAFDALDVVWPGETVSRSRQRTLERGPAERRA